MGISGECSVEKIYQNYVGVFEKLVMLPSRVQ